MHRVDVLLQGAASRKGGRTVRTAVGPAQWATFAYLYSGHNTIHFRDKTRELTGQNPGYFRDITQTLSGQNTGCNTGHFRDKIRNIFGT